MGIQQRILKFITCSNWILLLIASIAAASIAKFDFTLGIIAGGLIVTINFHLMYRTLQKTFNRPRIPSLKSIIARHYVRFMLSAVLIFVLISKHVVDPGGLLIGLSVVVVSIKIAALYELKNIIFKEAI
ncbi:MAG: ATP synthase subunit I [Thermodesulfobacteriota bacterium]